MKQLDTAIKVLKIFKKNGYEAYIVGGAVRDYLLKMPFSDIDITTNARPYQVAKMFDTKPTGIKYGTVTILFQSETFEVTTYRVDGPYEDARHPNDIIYSDSVIEDVARRDFRINGLLMDESLQIIDHVEGKIDLHNKMIQTIGNPYDRFNEDALRILRAVYFQSKLGFQIAKETRDAMHDLRFKLNDIAMERVLQELIKMLKEKHVKKAFKTLVTTQINEVLPGLEKGISYLAENDEVPFVDAFFTVCFALNNAMIPNEWPFSNKHKHKYQTAATLANAKTDFQAVDLYTYGIDICLLANRVNFILKRSKNMQNVLMQRYESLPLQSELDLKLKATDMMTILNKKAGAWLKEIQKEMVMAVLDQKLENNQDALTKYLIEHVK